MTAQTLAYMKANEFALTGAPSRITQVGMNDLIDSFPPWDTISGVATPNLLRGTYDGQAYFLLNGGALGSVSAGQRTTNGTVLNALFTAATTNNKFVELEDGTYQISAGLTWPADNNGIAFRGSRANTIIQQFGSNVPILTIGDAGGTTFTRNLDFRGIRLQYGASQTANTSAVALVLGSMSHSRIGEISIPNTGNPCYDAIKADVSGTFGYFFSNRIFDIDCWQFQHNGVYCSGTVGNTGNTWDNLYLSVGSVGAPGAITGSAINFGNLNSDDQLFTRINIEWLSGNIAPALNLEQIRGCVMIAVHMEGVQLTGASPYAITTLDNGLTIDGLDVIDLITQGATGTCDLIHSRDWTGGVGSSIKINNLNWTNNNATQLGTAINLFGVTALKDHVTNFSVDAFRLYGGVIADIRTALQLDSHMPAASFKAPEGFGNYTYGSGGSRTRDASIPVSATYTHYGQHEDATILVPISVTGFTITLAATMGATGTQKPRTGNTVRIMRQGAGATTGTVTITNGGPGGGNLTTPAVNGTAPLNAFAIFDGTNWANFTAVT